MFYCNNCTAYSKKNNQYSINLVNLFYHIIYHVNRFISMFSASDYHQTFSDHEPNLKRDAKRHPCLYTYAFTNT